MAADTNTQLHKPAAASGVARIRPGADFARALPAITTTSVLIPGRYWHAHGAAHSIADAVLPVASLSPEGAPLPASSAIRARWPCLALAALEPATLHPIEPVPAEALQPAVTPR